MPSHKIHISIAQEINKELGLNNDEISLGSVLPDLSIIEEHSFPHFQIKDEYPNNLANAEEFLKHYSLKDAISIGYLIHLLTDRFYNMRYLEKFFIFKDGKPYKMIDGITNENRKCIKKHDFHEYDKYLIDLGNIKPFKDINVISKVNNYGEIEFDKDKLKEYIQDFNKELENKYLNYTFYKYTKEELDKIYFDCINYIKDYFKKMNCLNSLLTFS